MFTVVKFIFKLTCYWRNKNLQKKHTLDISLGIICPTFIKFRMQAKIKLLKLKTSFSMRIHAMSLQTSI